MNSQQQIMVNDDDGYEDEIQAIVFFFLFIFMRLGEKMVNVNSCTCHLLFVS